MEPDKEWGMGADQGWRVSGDTLDCIHSASEVQTDTTHDLCYNLPMNPLLRTTPLSLVFVALVCCLWPDPVSASAATPPAACYTWTQVNDGGFGLGDPSSQTKPFDGEEGFEVTVYDGQLYVGMEADNLLGARLWRTKLGVTAPATQADWEEVIADDSELPWGVDNLKQVDHIDSLAGFNSYIFASSANRSINRTVNPLETPPGTRLFRSPSGDRGTWVDAIPALGAGFGNTDNENFKEMEVFNGWLCGGTANLVNGTQVWCTQGRHRLGSEKHERL